MSDMVYMDYNATAPTRPGVAEAMAEALTLGGNPSSVHRRGRAARAVIDMARQTIADLVGADANRFVFTSGGTEANAIVLLGAWRSRVLISAVEHASVWSAVPEAEVIPVNGNGVVDLAALDRLLAASSEPALVSVMMANNETGVVQPIADIATLARTHGALLHCDAVQALGKIPLDMAALGVDYLTLSAHKIGGPQGVGALAYGPGLQPAPLFRGGGQEQGVRGGTQNVPGIAGFGEAARQTAVAFDRQQEIAALRDQLEDRVRAHSPESRIFGDVVGRLPNTSCFDLPGVPASTQVMALDLAGVMISAGSACHSGTVKPSRVLLAMGLSPEVTANAIRVSLGYGSRQADLDRFFSAWAAVKRPNAA